MLPGINIFRMLPHEERMDKLKKRKTLLMSMLDKTEESFRHDEMMGELRTISTELRALPHTTQAGGG